MVNVALITTNALETVAKSVTADRLRAMQNLVDDHKATMSDAAYKDACDTMHAVYKLCCEEIPQCRAVTDATSQRLLYNSQNWRYISYRLNDQTRADRMWAESVMDRLETFVPRA